VNGKEFQNDGMSRCHSNETGSRDESPKRTENELDKPDVKFQLFIEIERVKTAITWRQECAGISFDFTHVKHPILQFLYLIR
jgi:hypothetical protein